MILSMTGYGKAVAELQSGRLTVEIRSVNGKNADISIKTSLFPREHEMELRKLLSDRLRRGSIDLFATLEASAASAAAPIDAALAGEYFRQLEGLASAVGAENLVKDNPNLLISTLLQMPDVMSAKRSSQLPEEEWAQALAAVESALDSIEAFRKKEGEVLAADIRSRVATILALEDEVESFEAQRLEAVRERIRKAAEELGIALEPGRFEQEMVYYLEKLDITEEKVRLRQHCRYFLDTLDNEDCPGRKLGFIIQEMGREINTTGSKANHPGIQNAVIRMKDELEKIREQSMNIL